MTLHKPKGTGRASHALLLLVLEGGCSVVAAAHGWREDAQLLPYPISSGQARGWRSSGHAAYAGWGRWCPPVLAKTWQQLWSWTWFPFLLLLHLKKKKKKVSYICVYICVSIVSHDLTCHILLLQHPSEIAFLNKETQLYGVCKVLCKKM